jgi:hypothetical protein
MMKKSICISLIALMICMVISGCDSNSGKGIILHETPQVYILDSEDDRDRFESMPTVTLYENGNARLSQPPISSFGLIGIGRYSVEGDELTVSHGEGVSATFTISGRGNTLTIKSAAILFTNVGAVYKYAPGGWIQSGSFNNQPSKEYKPVEGEKLTVDILHELGKNPQSISLSDFEKYEHYVIDPDFYLLGVDGEYFVRVFLDADGNISCYVERNSSGEDFPLHRNGSAGFDFDSFLG